LNSCTKISVKTPYGNTDVFELEELVRQGSVLGAVISANSLETVVRDAQNGMAGSRLGNMSLYPLCFVDDIAAVSNSLMDARRNQVAIEVFQDRNRLQLHPEKSQYLVNRGNRKRRDEELKLNGMNMKKANEYKYLGEYINENGTETTTVEKKSLRQLVYVMKFWQ